jgi:nucleotide-binding universal stress UspA family protein
MAGQMAADHDARLTVLHVGLIPGSWAGGPYVVDPPPALAHAYDAAALEQRAALEKLVSERVPPGVARTVRLREGDVAAEIAAEAKDCGAELVVIGSHGRSGVARALPGSVAERVLRISPAPVLVVKS